MKEALSATPQVVGREPELGVLRRHFEAGASGRALMITGGAGIGKTTLWEAGIDRARELGYRVLVARPSSAEARLSFAALIDLFETVDAETLATVAAPQRSALEVALLRAQPTGIAPEPHAISLGLLNGLRMLATGGPVLIAVDDVQWLDPPSADALAFAARRVKDQPVAFLLARRPGSAIALEQTLRLWELKRLDVGPLGFAASRRLLSDRLGLVLPRQYLRRVVQATLGNPLFVLEVGRAVLDRGAPQVGDDIPVPAGVEELLDTRVGRLAPALRRLLLAVALSADLVVDELAAVVGVQAVEDAVDAGLLVVDGTRARPAHPLFAAAAKERSRPSERRGLHQALAGVTADRELRALHLALATERPDPELGATLAAAAREASARGDRHQAVLLAEHALRLTPPGSAQRVENLLALAGDLETAGELGRMTELLVPELDSLPSGGARARALLMFAESDHIRAADEYDRHLDLALAETADEPGLRAQALAAKVTNAAAASVCRLAEAESWASEALPGARRAGPEAERTVLYALGWASAMRGRSIDDLCERFRAASDAAFYIAHSPVRVAAQRLVWRGEVTRARVELTRLLALADERGEPSSYALQRLHLCELELRAGGFKEASRLLDEWAESSEGQLLNFPMYERCRALLAAGRGLAEDVEGWVDRAIAAAERDAVRWDWLEALRARGIAALLEQDPARAARTLRPVWEHTSREGVDDPGVFPVAPELVEGLAELGEADEALEVTARLQRLSDEQQHPWGLATARRCRAAIQLGAAPYDEQAAAALVAAAEDYARLGLRFDHARSLLSLGRAQRRMKQWGAARESLRAAVAAFEEQGSSGWARRASSELDRVGARRPRRTGELTASEREIVELAAKGRSNKEIAQALSIAVHTVEVHLSRAYAKLGIHSRAQLAERLSVRAVGD
ncbi:MAG TPA: AAA family ATPase [Solirubrobacteraceae bacterium]|nr:AAA family ATPase [Solirubrobacteraceae bacterium]